MSEARYEKFVRDVEYDVNRTLQENVALLRTMRPSVVSSDWSVDWIAPSVKISANVIDLAGSLLVHWRNMVLTVDEP